MAYVRKNLNEIVAELPGVQAHVSSQASQLKSRIQRHIIPFSKTGNLFRSVKIEMSAKGKDRWVVVEADYAAAVNFGFTHNWTGDRIAGKNFIKKAVYGG